MDWLGVDIGWVFPAADSDGLIYNWADRAGERHAARLLADAGPVTIRRTDGTVEVREPYRPADYAEIANRREYSQRCRRLANRILVGCRDTCRGLALEDWTGDGRHTNFLVLYQALVIGTRDRRIPLALVNRAYTSQTCPSCQHVDEANRPERNWFECVRCGTEGQADVIAARNIAAKAIAGDARFLAWVPKLTQADLAFLSRTAS